MPAAPIAWNGLVFIGNAGGDFKGGKGHMYALDAKTGTVVWEFFLVPKAEGDTVRGPQGASPLDNATWKNIPGAPISGGGAWAAATLDPATGLLYVPVGNPAPDFDIGAARGRTSIPTRSSSSTPRPAPTRIISRSCPGIGTTGTLPTRPL